METFALPTPDEVCKLGPMGSYNTGSDQAMKDKVSLLSTKPEYKRGELRARVGRTTSNKIEPYKILIQLAAKGTDTTGTCNCEHFEKLHLSDPHKCWPWCKHLVATMERCRKLVANGSSPTLNKAAVYVARTILAEKYVENK
jgi:hypothetical protein